MITLKERQEFIERNRHRFTPERLLEVVGKLSRDRALCYNAEKYPHRFGLQSLRY